MWRTGLRTAYCSAPIRDSRRFPSLPVADFSRQSGKTYPKNFWRFRSCIPTFVCRKTGGSEQLPPAGFHVKNTPDGSQQNSKCKTNNCFKDIIQRNSNFPYPTWTITRRSRIDDLWYTNTFGDFKLEKSNLDMDEQWNKTRYPNLDVEEGENGENEW